MKKFFLLGLLASAALSVSAQTRPDVSQPLAVDLGLPSGLKWADRNIGADKPEACGSHFAWGETTPKSDYGWSTYKHGSAESQLTKYCNNGTCGKGGFTDGRQTLEPEDDAAHANWGGRWRMPTKADFEELKAHTISEWVENYNGTDAKGYLFTAPNGNSIFLPAAGGRHGTALDYAGSDGDYWSGTLREDDPNYAYSLFFYPDDADFCDYYNRCYGHTVRPVQQ